jgi:alpha-glucosidase
MRRVVETYGPDHVLIGEAYLPIDRLVTYYGAALDGFHLPFNFHLLTTPWTPRAIARLAADYEGLLPPGAWPNWVLGNHDRQRLASRVGPAQIRVAAMLLLTLRGTPTLYQGDELGMLDTPTAPDQVRDPWELNVPGLGLGRDPVRTPMPWDASDGAGFTTGTPWLPLASNSAEINAARQAEDPASPLRFYRRLIGLRRSEPALTHGAFVSIGADDAVLRYERRWSGGRVLVALNFTGRAARCVVPDAVLTLSTHDRPAGEQIKDALTLAANEGVVLRLS